MSLHSPHKEETQWDRLGCCLETILVADGQGLSSLAKVWLQVNLKVLCSITYRTYIHYIVVFSSILFYYFFLAMYSLLRPGALNRVGKSDNAYWVIFEVTAVMHMELNKHNSTWFQCLTGQACTYKIAGAWLHFINFCCYCSPSKILSVPFLHCQHLLVQGWSAMYRLQRACQALNIPARDCISTKNCIFLHLPTSAFWDRQYGKEDLSRTSSNCMILQLAGKPAFWLAMLLGVSTALLPGLAWQGICRTYFPTDVNLIQVWGMPILPPAGFLLLPEHISNLNPFWRAVVEWWEQRLSWLLEVDIRGVADESILIYSLGHSQALFLYLHYDLENCYKCLLEKMTSW